MTLKEQIASGLGSEDYEAFKQWIRLEIAKMVAEANTKHLIFTSFDQQLDASIKNTIIRHIFTEWDL